MQFPHVDPIPIPAPVWLMKTLGLLTLALHFYAVQLLIGSIIAVIVLSWWGTSSKNAAIKTAAYVIAKRQTIIMTYVINLGIPPLLFAQVLYGRALYTSSDLIAVWWISVILLLMVCYRLLYRVTALASEGKNASFIALIALILAGTVGRILSYNMTLMLRPDVWQQMYAVSASGTHLPPTEITGWWRWGFVMSGGFLVGGLWLALHSSIVTIEESVKAVLAKVGVIFTVIGGIIQIGVGYMVFTSQPAYVQTMVAGFPLCKISGILWIAGVLVAMVVSLTQLGKKAISPVISILGSVFAFLSIAGAVIVRDGIRDSSLFHFGFNVWDRVEVSNWPVIAIFLILFVITLGILGWLLWVMSKAKPIQEQVS